MERRRQVIATPVQQGDKKSELLAGRAAVEKLRNHTAQSSTPDSWQHDSLLC